MSIPRKPRLLTYNSPNWTRTNDLAVNSRSLYQLSYRGSGAWNYSKTTAFETRGVELIGDESYNMGLPCKSTGHWSTIMKNETHPEYHNDCKVFFRGDHVMTVGATVPEMHVDIWSGSHPFYTGKASFVDAAGRVEKFQNKFKGDYFKKKK